MYIYIYIYIYTHTCMHACMHTFMHTYIHTYIHTYKHMYVSIYIYIYTLFVLPLLCAFLYALFSSLYITSLTDLCVVVVTLFNLILHVCVAASVCLHVYDPSGVSIVLACHVRRPPSSLGGFQPGKTSPDPGAVSLTCNSGILMALGRQPASALRSRLRRNRIPRSRKPRSCESKFRKH